MAGVGILVAMLLLVLATYFLPAYQVCRDHVDSGVNVPACGPIRADDLPALALGLVLVFVLLPSWSELAFPGFGSIKKRLAALESKVEQIRMQQSVSNTTYLVTDLKQVEAEAKPRLDAFGSSESPVIPAPMPQSRLVSNERAQLESRLLRTWSDLEVWLGWLEKCRGLEWCEQTRFWRQRRANGRTLSRKRFRSSAAHAILSRTDPSRSAMTVTTECEWDLSVSQGHPSA